MIKMESNCKLCEGVIDYIKTFTYECHRCHDVVCNYCSSEKLMCYKYYGYRSIYHLVRLCIGCKAENIKG